MQLRLDVLDGAAVTIVAKVAPWLAPFPTAWLVYERTQRHLHWPWWVAVIAGLTLECLGVAILATTLELHNYNREKRQSDPAAVMWLPVSLVILYFLAAELLIVALDILPSWFASLAPAVFPVLSVVSMAVLAIRNDHDRRLTEIEQQKAEAKARRTERKQQQTEEQTEPSPFLCKICGIRFDTQNALNGHGNAHKRKEQP